jgi:hypothetical protein
MPLCRPCHEKRGGVDLSSRLGDHPSSQRGSPEQGGRELEVVSAALHWIACGDVNGVQEKRLDEGLSLVYPLLALRGEEKRRRPLPVPDYTSLQYTVRLLTLSTTTIYLPIRYSYTYTYLPTYIPPYLPFSLRGCSRLLRLFNSSINPAVNELNS